MSNEGPSSECCLPGDITITKVDRGYMLGRAIREYGHGAWWEYVTVVKTYGGAVRQARELAQATQARVWLHEDRQYTRIPDGQPVEEG
jgi:hypothetical protein